MLDESLNNLLRISVPPCLLSLGRTRSAAMRATHHPTIYRDEASSHFSISLNPICSSHVSRPVMLLYPAPGTTRLRWLSRCDVRHSPSRQTHHFYRVKVDIPSEHCISVIYKNPHLETLLRGIVFGWNSSRRVQNWHSNDFAAI